VTDHYTIKHRTDALGSAQYENRKRKCKQSCPGNLEKETMSLIKNIQELETAREKLREIKAKWSSDLSKCESSHQNAIRIQINYPKSAQQMSDLRLLIQERQLQKQEINFDVEITLKNLEHALLSESQNEISKIQNEAEKYHQLLISAIYTKLVASRPWSCLACSQQSQLGVVWRPQVKHKKAR